MKPEYYQRIPWLAEHDPDHLFDHLYTDLEWLEETPARKEYFMSTDQLTYAYGSGNFSRTYFSNPFSNPVEDMRRRLNNALEVDFNVCFLNRYDSEHSHLGWHADDSVEMNPDHPIAVVSVGAERDLVETYRSQRRDSIRSAAASSFWFPLYNARWISAEILTSDS
jgi:alkylated DNA repair dioxygenase AlkB